VGTKKSRTTEWRHRRAAQLAAQRAEGGLPVRITPETMVTVQERADYQAARRRHLDRFSNYDAGWERPTLDVARDVYALLKDHHLDVRLDSIHPDPLVAQQLLVVALDAAVTAGRYGNPQIRRGDDERRLTRVRRRLTRNALFDAVARRWSDRYREAREHGQAFTVSQMTEDTAKRCWRDLLVNDVALPALWETVTAKNPLFRVRLSKRTGGYNVILRRGPVLKAFERLVRRDPVYGPTRVQNVWWLWIDGEPQPPTEIHRRICAERRYNEVPVGGLTEEVLKIQEDARLLFDAPAFAADYKRVRATRKRIEHMMTVWSGHQGAMKMPWKHLDPEQQALKKRARKMTAFLLEFRSVYEQAVPLKRVVTIRSAFYKVLNRRFQNAHFFPMAVSDRGDQALPEILQFHRMNQEDLGLEIGDGDVQADADFFWAMTDSSRSRWFSVPGPNGPVPMIAVDVSSSQAQLTAALLGLPKPELKQHRAKRAWDARDRLLRDGYKEADDPLLIEAIKNLLMRLGYGSSVHNVVRAQSWEPETYGPGWVSSMAVEAFLDDLPGFKETRRFLGACRWIGRHADRFAGLALVDPLDETSFRWNPIQRADVPLRLDKWDVTLIKPGKYPGGLCPACASNRSDRRGNRRTCRNATCRHTWTIQFIPNDANAAADYPTDPVKLHNMAAPCVVHMLDALFAAHVILELRRRGVTNVVSIHDCWYIPETDNAQTVLQKAVEAAGEPWFRALENVYKLLLHYLKPSPDPEWWDLLVDAHRLWEDRVKRQDWPVFSVAVS
jgi:hypothetical protein